MTPHELTQASLVAFEQVLSGTAGFRLRPGQQAMAQRIASAMGAVTLGEHPDPVRAVSVIQAGTGVGKSAAYGPWPLCVQVQARPRERWRH